MRRSAAHRRCDVRAAEKRSVARSRKGLSNFRSTLPYKPSVSWWTAHGILTRHFASRGFSCASLLALRVLSEGVYPALSTVLLSFWLAVRDADEEMRVGGGGVGR